MTERQFVYDAGMLIAIDNRSAKAVKAHEGVLATGVRVIVPAVVAAQVVRRPASQARLMLALRGTRIVPFSSEHHAQVGQLLAAAGTSDVVDAFVVLTAVRLKAAIVTCDMADIRHLVDTLGVDLPVLAA